MAWAGRWAQRPHDYVRAHFGHGCEGVYAFWGGDLRKARACLERSLEFYGPEHEGGQYDTALYTFAFYFTTLWMVGHADRAWSVVARARAMAERRGDPYSLCTVHGFEAMLALECGDLDRAGALARDLMDLAVRQHLYAWWSPAAIACGRVMALQGRVDEGLALVREALERCKAMGVLASYSYHLRYLTACYLDAGRLDEAEQSIAECRHLCGTLLSRVSEPEALRLRGELERRRGRFDEAERSLRAAVEMAERDGTIAYALRAAVAAARLLADQGRRRDALALLSPVHARFTEGFATGDLRLAGALLEELAAGGDELWRGGSG
jgi:tetratricopeptide (TPR) repeat protein